MINFQTEGGEFKAVGFINQDHWEQVSATLEYAGVDYYDFVHPVSLLREYGAEASSGADDRSYGQRWNTQASAIQDDIEETKRLMSRQTPYGAMILGLAVPNLAYSTATTGEASAPANPGEELAEFDFLFGARLAAAPRIKSLSLEEVAVVLQYPNATSNS